MYNTICMVFFYRRCTGQGGTLFADFQALQRIWTHPIVMRLNAEKIEKANEKKDLSDSEGSLKDFINDDTTGTESLNSSSDSSSDSDVQAIDDEKNSLNIPKRRTRNNPGGKTPYIANNVLHTFRLISKNILN